MAAFCGQLTVILMDTIVVSTATGIPHTVGEKGTLLGGTPSDLSVAAAAAVQALVADCLSTSGVFHFFFTSIIKLYPGCFDCRSGFLWIHLQYERLVKKEFLVLD